MITFFISLYHTYTISLFLEAWPNQASACMRPIPYEWFHRIRSISPGLYIFSDIDRLCTEQRQQALQLCQIISEHFGNNLIWNDPSSVLDRFRLLSLLWNKGINRFRVYTIAKNEYPIQYPVFIRRTHDHSGPLTDLIMNKESFDNQLNNLLIDGEDPDQLIEEEFCDTRSNDQFFRKYSAFRIGDYIIPGHIIFSTNWVAKDGPPPESLLEEEKAYIERNPHRDALMNIFRLANIEYGRIDYGLSDGKIQVWEINTNPVLIREHHKYSQDKFLIKQRLVDEIARAFILQHKNKTNVMQQDHVVAVDLHQEANLTFLHKIERFVCPLDL